MNSESLLMSGLHLELELRGTISNYGIDSTESDWTWRFHPLNDSQFKDNLEWLPVRYLNKTAKALLYQEAPANRH